MRTEDRLVGAWRIVQLERGHRFNTDDVLTAWVGLRVAPTARRLLDLGSGVGSIGLIGLHARPGASLTSVEVQAVSADCMRRTLERNGVDATVVHADLRTFRSPERFDLVTGNPPYVPPEGGLHSPHPQKAAARMELHGDVFDWARCARHHLADQGRFVLCHAAADPRPERALRDAGLALLGRMDVRFREGQAPRIAIRVAGEGQRLELPPLAIRDGSGAWTERWLGIRHEVGLAESA